MLTSPQFKSNIRKTWRVIQVSKADSFFTESLRILAGAFISVGDQTPTEIKVCCYVPMALRSCRQYS